MLFWPAPCSVRRAWWFVELEQWGRRWEGSSFRVFPSESGLPATDMGVTHLKEMQKNQVSDAIPTPPPWDQAEGRHRPVMSSLPALSGFLHSLSPEGMWLWSLYCACLPSLLFWKARSLLHPAVVRDIGQITTNAGSQGSPGSVSRPGNDCIHG